MTVSIHVQEFVKWSSLREALKDLALQSHQTALARNPSGVTADDVSKVLLQSLAQVSRSDSEPASLTEKLEHAAREVLPAIEHFLELNRLSVPAKLHPACRGLVPTVWARMTNLNSDDCGVL